MQAMRLTLEMPMEMLSTCIAISRKISNHLNLTYQYKHTTNISIIALTCKQFMLKIETQMPIKINKNLKMKD